MYLLLWDTSYCAFVQIQLQYDVILYYDDQNVMVAINMLSRDVAILQNWAFTTLSKSCHVNVQPHKFGRD